MQNVCFNTHFRQLNIKHIVTFLQSQNNVSRVASIEPIFKSVVYAYVFAKQANEYHEAIILSGDINNIRAWGIVHTLDGYYENAADRRIKWEMKNENLIEENDHDLRDASEIIENCT